VTDDEFTTYGTDRRTTVIARTVTRLVVPIVLVTAVALLLQGHNYPGGGFIGGVLTAVGFVLIYIIFGLEDVSSDVLRMRPTEDEHGPIGAYRRLFGLGLALAFVSGLVPILFGYEFLTQAVFFLEHVPLYGEFEIASAFAFDLGVYFTVVGALLTIAAEVGKQ
jgi:multicomponent Na+:H+ antiporter subunit B